MNTNEATPLSNEELVAFYIADQNDQRDAQRNTALVVKQTAENFLSNLGSAIVSSNTAANARYEQLLTVMKEQNTGITKYYDGINQNIQLLANAVDVLNNSLNNINTAIIDSSTASVAAIKNAADMSRKQLFAINAEAKVPKNSLFYSSKSLKQQVLWIDHIKGLIADICEAEDIDKTTAYNKIWSLMKGSYDIPQLVRMFKEQIGRSPLNNLEVLSYSDILRNSFESYAESLRTKAVVDKNVIKAKSKAQHTTRQTSRHTAKSVNTTKCPAEVKEIVSKLSRTGKTSGMMYNKAYKMLGVDLNELVAVTAKSLGIKKCSVAFAISQNPFLMNVLEKAVNQYVKECE